jgi:hypothetical protein
MKKILLIASAALVAFAACKKTNDVSKVVTVSAPTININGSKFITLNVGSPYVDSGATLIDDVTGQSSQIQADTTDGNGVVDVNTPGMYTLTYSAKNANGYGSINARYIAVTNYADAANLSGTYVRQSNQRAVHVTRKSRALYMIDDFGGAGIPDAGYFAVLDTAHIDFGYQYSETIGAYFTAKVSYLHVRPGDTSFAYALSAAGYGTAVRVFKKK